MDHIDESPLTAEEQANLDLLKITDKGLLTGVTDKEKLVGNLVIPDSVTAIGNFIFSWCTDLTSVVIPDSVTVIGRAAFAGCTGLTTVVISDSVTKIGSGVFSHCTNLIHLIVDNANTVYCSEHNIIFTKDKKKLIAAAGALKGHIVVPDTVTEIGVNAFSGCTGLTSIVIPDSVTVIGMAAFAGCAGLTSVVIPNSVTEIGIASFSGCTGLTDIIIPDSVTEIGDSAFSDCTGLTSIVIPDSVTEIGANTFSGVSSDAHFTVTNKLMKKKLLNSGSNIRDEQITVDVNL